MIYYDTQNWVQFIIRACNVWNRSVIPSLGYSPYQIIRMQPDDPRIEEIYHKQELKILKQKSKNPKMEELNVGDYVRTNILMNPEVRARWKNMKKYGRMWSKEIYRVYRISPGTVRSEPVYTLQDIQNGLLLRNRYFRSYLQKIPNELVTIQGYQNMPPPDIPPEFHFDRERHLRELPYREVIEPRERRVIPNIQERPRRNRRAPRRYRE